MPLACRLLFAFIGKSTTKTHPLSSYKVRCQAIKSTASEPLKHVSSLLTCLRGPLAALLLVQDITEILS